MKTKKYLPHVSLLIGFLVMVVALVALVNSWGVKRAIAATDTCNGVSTVFNATAPASVTVGQSFTLSGISSTPATNYGFTILSSTLNLSATGATPTTYSQNDSSVTTISPTVATNYYPDWALTATGAAGSQIVIKLVQATANVSGVGAINCALSATLATVNVTAPAAPGGGGGSSGGSGGSGGSGSTGSSGSGSTPKATTTTPKTTTPTTTTPAATANPQTTTTTDTTTTTPATTTATQNTDDVSNQTITMRILVVNGQKHPISGATVTLDGQLSAKTGSNGIASFASIRKGTHTVSVVKGKQKITKNVQATSINTISAAVVIPTEPNWLLYGAAGVGVIILLFGGGLFAKKLRPQSNIQPITPAPPAEPETPTVLPPAIEPAPVAPEPTPPLAPQPQVIEPALVTPPPMPPPETLVVEPTAVVPEPAPVVQQPAPTVPPSAPPTSPPSSVEPQL